LVPEIEGIAIELVSEGELFDYVLFGGAFSEKLARSYFKQLLDGLGYMHSKGYCHRDIKPENLLLD
jgi:serine/threonine protein kinase